MTDNLFTMSDADLLKRYRRALAEIMSGRVDLLEKLEAENE